VAASRWIPGTRCEVGNSVAVTRARDPRAWVVDPVESGPRAGFGVYLHVPFCHHRCGYCDFAVAAVGALDEDRREDLEARYVAALTADLARQVAAGPRTHAPADAEVPDIWPEATSIYVGGGTPTLLAPDRLAALLRAVRQELDVAADAEVTVEANPETGSPELLAALVDAGVTRLSIGAQSFTPHVLATLERGHDADAPLAMAAAARAAGIAQVSLDLIYGTPGESDADWEATLARVLTTDVDHVSAYALTVHEGTPFGRRRDRGTLADVDEDVQAARFATLGRVLGAGGFTHYEVSNLARGATGRSRHNLLYWRHGDYLGVGAGAHGHLAGRRWWSQRSTPRYVHAVEQAAAQPWGQGASPLAGEEVLDDRQRAAERLLLGLRVREGLHPNDLPPIAALALEDALDAGLVETACGRLRCTERGWFLLDAAVDRLTV
jgi:putative oxygen-independent coproporphyrinogen III oxidase